MATVSTMLMYALAKIGSKVTLIADGDPTTDSNTLLRERFALEEISNFHIHLFKRTIFNKVKCTPWFYTRACAYILRNRRRDMKTVVISRHTIFLPWLVALKWLFGCTVLFESHCYHGRCSLRGISEPVNSKVFRIPDQYRWMERMFLNACDGLLCQSKLQQEIYIKDFVRVPTVIIPHGRRPKLLRTHCVDQYKRQLRISVITFFMSIRMLSWMRFP